MASHMYLGAASWTLKRLRVSPPLPGSVDGIGTTACAYTGFGALQSEDGPWANDTVSYLYDYGRRRSALFVQSPNGSGVWPSSSSSQYYYYDQGKRLYNVNAGFGSFSYYYHSGLGSSPSSSALVKKVSLPNSSYITNTFDDWGRMVSTTLKNSGGTALDGASYSYNEINQRSGYSRWPENSGVSYGYDAFEQLISATGAETGGTNRWQEQFTYAYDLAGNLTNRIENKLTNVFAVNNLNQLSTGTRTGKLTVRVPVL